MNIPIENDMKSSHVKDVIRVVAIFSGVIAALGTLTNSVSLSYFIKKCEEGVSRQLFILLNIFDLLVCVSEVPSLLLYNCQNEDICGNKKFPFIASLSMLEVSIESTGFATCLLGVTRVIAVCFPFHQINGKALNVAIAIFIGQAIFMALLRFYFFYVDFSKIHIHAGLDSSAMMILLTIFIVINTTSSILLSWKLQKDVTRVGHDIQESATRKTKMRATVTVLIVSGFFLFLNIFFGIALYLLMYVGTDGLTTNEYVFAVMAIWLAIPLNSAVNPLIFFLRKREMREYVTQLPQALRRSIFANPN